MASAATPCHLAAVSASIFSFVRLLSFGGGGFYLGGAVGGIIGLILLVCLVLQLMGGFHAQN